MIKLTVRSRLREREDGLSPFAAREWQGRGRDRQEEPSELRTEYQRDRILHSKSFRRLKHKTQVFIAPAGDHYVTRLTHTLEVSQIARTIARALDLNEDLTEAISLGHDMGHTPFGHIGESEMDRLHPDGFRHAAQSLRIVEQLEKEGEGLNLTWEVRQGIVSHSKPRGGILGNTVTDGLTLEGQICRVADAVAYLNHDLADSFRAGLLAPDDLPAPVVRVLGGHHSQRINTMVSDIVSSSWAATGEDGGDTASPPAIAMSPRVSEAVDILREFMFERVYVPEDAGEEGQSARRVIRLLYEHFSRDPDATSSNNGRSVVDHIAGMTDQYAIAVAEGIETGVAEGIQRAQV